MAAQEKDQLARIQILNKIDQDGKDLSNLGPQNGIDLAIATRNTLAADKEVEDLMLKEAKANGGSTTVKDADKALQTAEEQVKQIEGILQEQRSCLRAGDCPSEDKSDPKGKGRATAFSDVMAAFEIDDYGDGGDDDGDDNVFTDADFMETQAYLTSLYGMTSPSM